MNTAYNRSATNYQDEWFTPPHIVQALGNFDLDPCSPITRLNETAKNYFTINDDGLSKEWFGRVWLNPPYSNIKPWMQKVAEYGNATALIFARTETEFFHSYVWEKADSIFFFKKRLYFIQPNGETKYNAGAPSVLVGYGSQNVEALAECKLPGKHLIINPTTIIAVIISPSWSVVVKKCTQHYSDKDLQSIYEMVQRIAPDKVEKNKHWKEKIRQKIQTLRKKDQLTIF